MGITAWNIRRHSQIDKISGKFRILPELHITKSMGLGSNNHMLSNMDALEYPINEKMLIWNNIWDVIGGSGQITAGITMTVDMFR